MTFYFAPDQDCLTPLLDMINNAKTQVTIADYSYNIPALTYALITAKQRGVKVRMVLDRSQSKGSTEIPQIQLLRNAGIDFVIGTSDKHRIMHLKVAVADDTVAFGSYNFTTTAALESNVLAVETDPVVAAQFTSQINHVYLWIVQNEPQALSLKLGKDNMNYKDIAVRAAKTFGQAFVAALLASGFGWLSAPSLSVVEKVLLAAVVAAVSVVWNTVLVPVFKPVSAKFGL